MTAEKPLYPSVDLSLEPGSVCLMVSVPDLFNDEASEFTTKLAYNLPTDMAPANRVDLHRIALGMEAYLLSLPGEFVKMGRAVQENAKKLNDAKPAEEAA